MDGTINKPAVSNKDAYIKKEQQKLLKEKRQKERELALKRIEQYADSSPNFNYGVDDLLNTLNVLSIEELKLPKKYLPMFDKIKTKRIRFLRSQLGNPNTTSAQIKGIEIALALHAEENSKESNDSGITIEFVSNLGGNDEQD